MSTSSETKVVRYIAQSLSVADSRGFHLAFTDICMHMLIMQSVDLHGNNTIEQCGCIRVC